MFSVIFEYISFCSLAIVAACTSNKSQNKKAHKAEHHVLGSQENQKQVQKEFHGLADIVRNVCEHAPNLQLSEDYIHHVVLGLRTASHRYQAATLQQENATSQLLTAQAVTLEVMGETHALSLPNTQINIGKTKDKPCILGSQRYTTEENLHNHIVKERGKVLDDFVSAVCTFLLFIVFGLIQIRFPYEECMYK